MDELKLKLRKLRRPRKTKEVQQKAGSQDTDHLIGAFHHQRVWTEDTQQRYHPATKGIRSIAQVDRHKSQQYKHQQQVELLPNNSNAALFLVRGAPRYCQVHQTNDTGCCRGGSVLDPSAQVHRGLKKPCNFELLPKLSVLSCEALAGSRMDPQIGKNTHLSANS